MTRATRVGQARHGAAFIVITCFLLIGAPAKAQSGSAPACTSNTTPAPWFGISGIACSCDVKTNPDGTREWTFRTELEILSVDPGGPSNGILQPGDIIVAIDGQLITTRAGATAWNSMRPGEAHVFRVRRNGGLLDLSIPVRTRCVEPRADAGISEARAERQVERRLLPRGWLGIGLACDCTVSAGSDYPIWMFEQLPTIRAVAPDSPGSAAGLRAGDVLVRVNGLRLDTQAGGQEFSRIRPGSRVRLQVRRSGALLSLEITADSLPGHP
jgi:S1-C subfamily serine protease